MNLKQGQEVRDAADPNRIGIVVGTGSSLGARVLWCFDERLTWTSERPVVLPARTPADVLTDPQPGAVWTEYAAWPDGFITDIDDTGRATLNASESRDSIVRVWAFEPPKSYQHARELAAASDVPPPAP